MTRSQNYINRRSYYFRRMMHGYGPGPVPFLIARLYWSIAKFRVSEDLTYKISGMI